MIRKLALFVCAIEYALVALFILVIVPVPPGKVPVLPGGPTLSTIIDFGGFCILGVGFLLYCIGAIRAALGKVAEFWNSSMPLIGALPILIWGVGKLQLAAGWSVALLVLLLCMLLMVFVAAKTSILRWRALPAVLMVLCLPSADLRISWMLYIPVGALLAVASVLLFGRRLLQAKKEASAPR